MVTLYLWWSSDYSSGLFLVGIVLAAPPVLLAAPSLLLLGDRLDIRGRGWRPAGTGSRY